MGSNFAPGVTVTIGGVPAMNVTVIDSTMIAATAPPHASGPADVVISSAGRAVTLTAGFTYTQVENAPPIISSVIAQGTRRNEPSNFADLNEEIDVVASVSDEETPIEELTYEWTADAGSFSGSGPAVKWRAPVSLNKTPADNVLQLTVREAYKATDDSGAVVDRENVASRVVTVHVHNSRKETSDLAGEFLIDFSNSAVSADRAVRSFSTNQSCGGTQEHDEIAANRARYTITASRLGFPADVAFNFGSACTVDRFQSVPGDACVKLSCGWTSTVKVGYVDSDGTVVPAGAVERVDGTCTLSELYEADRDRWQMCWSEFRGTVARTGRAVRSFSFQP